MKKGLLTAALTAALLPLAGAEKIFDLSFDDYTVTPQIAKGKKAPEGFTDPDLQLRMHSGIRNRGNALNLGNRERLDFKMRGNFDPKEGTVILWLAPQNWSVTESNFQLFFYAQQPKYNLRIAKTWANYITANIKYDIPYQGKKYFGTQVQARIDPAEWTPGRFHQLAVTWTGETINLYIDGERPQKTPIFIGSRNVPPTAPVRKFPTPVEFPEAAGAFSIGASSWLRNKLVDPKHSTVFDQITIWDKALPEDKIREEYEKVIPPAPQKIVNLLTIPKLDGGGEVTGALSDPVWQNAVKVPLLPVGDAPENNLSALIWHNGRELHVGFTTDARCQKRNLKKNDAPMWQDDVFEIHLRTADRNNYHYIVNGNGKIYDALNGRPAWNGKARAAAKHENNGWSAELVIPLNEFDADEFEVEFGAGSRPGIRYHLYRWGGRGKALGPAGKMKLGRTSATLRMDTIGEPENGRLDLKGFSSLDAKLVIEKKGDAPLQLPIIHGKFELNPRLQPGRQRLELSARGFLWSREIFVRHPLSLAFDFKMRSRTLDVTVDFNSADENTRKMLEKSGLPLELTLKDSRGTTIASRKATVTKIKSVIPFPLPENLGAGSYQLTAKSRKIVSSIPLRCPDPAPYKGKLGVDHTVPAPWTPVKKVTDKIFEVWARQYEFQNGPLPCRMIHGGENLLDSAPVWTFNGGKIAWRPSMVTETWPDRVTLAGEGSADGITISWQGELYFDGAYILKMRLIPAGKTAISDFGFRYAVSPVAGRYAMNPEYMKWQDNRVELQLGPGKGRKENLLWLAGVEKGVMIWTQSNANWVTAPKTAPLTAVRRTSQTDVTVQIISRKVTLSKQADYTFVFMATPSRPFPENHRSVNYGGYHINPCTTHQSIGWGQFKESIHGDDPAHFNTPYPAYPEKLRKTIAGYLARNGARLHYYTMPGVLSDTAPDSDYWSKTLKTIPEESYSYVKGRRFTATRTCTRTTSAPADYWTWTLNRLLKDFPDMGGLYFDCASTRFCANSEHGCSGIDSFGQPYVTSDALGLRDFMMRVYKVNKQYKNASMMIHSHVQFVPFCHSFTDFFAPGENSCEAVYRNQEYPYTEEVSLEEYQTDYNSRKSGVAFCMILQNARAAGIMPSLRSWRKRYLTEPEFAIRAITPFLIHDVNIWDAGVQRKTIIRYWKMRKDIQIGKASRFIGYWEKNCPVRSGTPEIYCSVYEWKDKAPWRRVVAAGNFSRKEKSIALHIDWQALGVNKSDTVRELWTGRDIPVSGLGTFRLKGGHFALFGIK